MSGAFVLLQIAAYVTLLLWGTHMVTSGVLKGFGGVLRQRIGGALSSTPRAFLSGIGVTLALQSSTATGLMASSFAAHGVLAAVPGFVLMLGANVGTALVTQVFSFPTAILSSPLFLFGYVFFRKSHSTRWKHVGRALIGMGLMFLSLHELVGTFEPISQIPVVRSVVEALGNQVILALLLGILAAWCCHSSVAVVLLVMSMASSGILPLEAGLAMVLGANLGGAIPPALEAESAVARRIPTGNLLVRAVGVLVGMAVLPEVVIGLKWMGHTDPHALVDCHVAFNVVLAFAAMPFARPVSALLVRLLPDPPFEEDKGKPRYLDSALLGQPHLALANVEREALRLSDSLAEQLAGAEVALMKGDPDAAMLVSRRGDTVTSLGRSIRHHLSRLPPDSMNEQELSRTHELITFVINAEHVADLVPHHLVEPMIDRAAAGEVMDGESQKVLGEVLASLRDSLGLSVAVLLRRDLRAARTLVEKKTALRAFEQRRNHTRPASVSWPNTMGATEMDQLLKALRECRRIHGHLAAIAYHVLEDAGQLRSRVSEGDGS